MQRLEVSGAVRPLKWSLGVKGLILPRDTLYNPLPVVFVVRKFGGSPAPFRHTLHIHPIYTG